MRARIDNPMMQFDKKTQAAIIKAASEEFER